ncbi:hypothetical protein EG329_004936 [Mollisiaceae sp. DMI_Dod_QoI]|nr:hypothetical protein EG329_004936 [Helotiales sp. DMI_Dod_QoI]
MPGAKASGRPQARLPNYPFIISNEATNTDPETRKGIRRHVMLGKNRGKYRRSGHGTLVTPEDVAISDDGYTPVEEPHVAVPRTIGTYLAFTPLPEMVERHAAVEAIHTVTSALKARFVLGTCLVFDAPDSTLLERHSHDATFFQSVIWMTQAFRESAQGNGSGYPDRRPLLKTLRLLREKLSLMDERTQVPDETLFVVTNLAAHARVAGEDQSAMHHMEGIRKIVGLRGGISEITHPKLMVELLRCDLGMALHTGAKSFFCYEVPYFDYFLQYPDEVGFQRETDRSFDGLDHNIITAWQFMKRFCSVINAAAEAEGRVPWKVFLDSMKSVMYRLLNMRFDAGSINETIRLGLLSFSSSVFLQWKLVRLPFTYLTDSYRDSLNILESSDFLSPELYSWLLMVYFVSAFKQPDDDPWLCTRLRASMESCGVNSWNEMQTVLETLMWIRLLPEDARKDVFDSVFRT